MAKKAWMGIGAVAVSLVASGPVLAQQRVLAEATLLGTSPCAESEIEVFVQGNPANRGRIEVSAVEIGVCPDENEGEVLLDARANANLARGALSVEGQEVRLNATVPVVDALTRNAVNMVLDLTWVGGEQVVVTTRRDIEARGRFVRGSRGVTRAVAEAEASGTVVADGQTLFDGSSDDATIWTIR